MTTRSGYDEAVAVRAAGDGRFDGEIDARWNIASIPHGGYVLAVAVSALAETLPQPDPVSVSAHFTSRADAGPVEIRTERIHVGRTHGTAVARLVQQGTVRVHVAATFADLADARGTTMPAEPPPAIPSPEECVPAAGPAAPDFVRQLDLRLTPASAGWAVGRPSGTMEMAGWVRFPDGRAPDTRSLAMFADAFPPTVFNALGLLPWVPTLELTLHVRRRPAAGWLACRFVTRHVVGGYFEEDGEIWDESGALVALSRQLARLRA